MNDQCNNDFESRANLLGVGRLFHSVQKARRDKLSQGTSTICSTMPTIRIYASELQCMCRNAFQWGVRETGGSLFGAHTGSGVPVVMLTTLPGEKCEHHATSFRQDPDRFRACSSYLYERHGLCAVGRWHYHHKLGLFLPSGGDWDTARSTLDKNPHLREFCELILTDDAKSGSIRVHAYVYVCGGTLELRPAKLVVLSDPISPYRDRILGSVVSPTREQSEWCFPMERIVINGTVAESTPAIPDVLIQQISELPSDIQAGVRIACQEGAISIELPLEGPARGIIGYAEEFPDRPAAVFIVRESIGSLYDATTVINPDNRPLSLAVMRHRLLQHHQPGVSHVCVQDRPQIPEPAASDALTPSTTAATSEPAPKPLETKRNVAKRVFKKAVASLAGMGHEAKRSKSINPNRS